VTTSIANRRSVLLLAAVSAWAAGCHHWEGRSHDSSPLAKASLYADCSVLEILTLEINRSREDELASFWKEVDCQAIPVEQRRAMDRNGFRAGVAASQLPASIHRLMRTSDADRLTATPYRQIQNRSGQTHDLDITPPVETMNWRVEGLNQPPRVGSCQNAACAFAIKTIPFGDRSVQVELTPKIRYGSPRPKITVEQNQFSLRPILDELTFAEIGFGTRLRVGQTLIVGAAEAPTGLAREFFEDAPAERTRILLIRLVHSQMDDLFAPDRIQTPIATRWD
jgi:hypothetical protein